MILENFEKKFNGVKLHKACCCNKNKHETFINSRYDNYHFGGCKLWSRGKQITLVSFCKASRLFLQKQYWEARQQCMEENFL
jgi:hypothetical protein